MLKDTARALADFFYPPRCAGCGGRVTDSRALCADCRGNMSCVRYYTAHGLLYLDAVIVLARYRGGLQTVLQKIKFSGQQSLLPLLNRELGLLWAEGGRLLPARGSLAAVPVPTDAERLRERGYDLPEQIFKHWSEAEGYRWRPCLERIAHRPPQYGLSGPERRNNMRGVMAARYLPPEDTLLIADDILTTGATLSECARALRAAGGGDKLIIGLALAGDAPEEI